MIRTSTFGSRGYIGVCTALFLTAFGATSGYVQASEEVAIEHRGPAGISWDVQVPFESLVLVVVGIQGEVFRDEFESSPSYSLSDQEGNLLPDGQYKYELTVTPHIDPAVRQELEAVRESGDETTLRQMMLQYGIPTEGLRFAGSFSIEGGNLVTGQVPEDGSTLSSTSTTLSTAEEPIPPADFLIADDLIVQGSACIGGDCVNGEPFGFDTIRLKENNLRILFQDTSTGSFPTNDWQLTANDSSSGGANKFSIEDIDGAKVPFTVEAGAPSNSLYVDDGGRVGYGTSTPVVEQHSKDGDTPTLRLEQDGSSGFSPQTWDIASNETNFFIRDVTNGSTLPFRIQPGAPSDSVYIASDGDVGLGTASPGFTMEMRKTGQNAAFILTRTDGAQNYINATSTFGNFGTVTDHPLRLVANGLWKMRINTDGTLQMVDGGSYNGTWNNASSRDYKENIEDLSVDEAVGAFDKLSPVKFNYKSQREETRLGFIAEDVPELVAMNGKKNLSTMDIVAVLTRVVQEQQKLIRDQQKTLLEISERMKLIERGLMLNEVVPGVEAR